MKWRWLPLSTRNDDAFDFSTARLTRRTSGVVHLRAVAVHDDPVAVFEIADRIRERRQRDGVGAEIHLAVAIADRQRRAAARADQKIVLALEQEGERESALQPRQRGGDRVGRRKSLAQLRADEMGDHFGVGFGREFRAASFSLGAQLAEIFDDAVVDDRDAVGGVRMRVDFVRTAMGRPARVADADLAAERLLVQPLLEIAQLALGAAAREMAIFQRGNAGGIVAAVLQPLERIDHQAGDRLTADNSNNSAHA